MKKHVLLTGGTGLIGNLLTNALLEKGYEVSHLSRTPDKNPQVKTYLWDVNKGQIDAASIDGVDTIVHLAGAGVAEKRWTDKRKKEIIDSRVKSTALIYDLLAKKNHLVKTFISASGSGYYGDRADELLTEESAPGNDFLAQVCIQWEDAADRMQDIGLRVVKFRTGVVLNKKGGALPSLATPIKLGVGSPLGNGKQWMPWIHWQDVIGMYIYAVEHVNLKGIYNMAGPNPVTNKQITKAVAKQLHRPLWAPNVPKFVLKLLLGEMASVVTTSDKTSAQKIEAVGFKFKYPELQGALSEIYG